MWFQQRPLDEFGGALVRFERERSSRVSVCNLGVPEAANEFEMSTAARPGGHMSLAVSLLRVRYAAARPFPLRLAVGFDVDGGDLGRFAQGWRDLFAPRT